MEANVVEVIVSVRIVFSPLPLYCDSFLHSKLLFCRYCIVYRQQTLLSHDNFSKDVINVNEEQVWYWYGPLRDSHFYGRPRGSLSINNYSLNSNT